MTRSIQSPPTARIRSRFWRGVFEGTRIRPRISRARQLKATPWPWLPALAQITPPERSPGPSSDIRL